MTPDELANDLQERFPHVVEDYADVVAAVLGALKKAMHQQGYHAEAAVLGAFLGDLAEREADSVQLIAEAMISVAERRGRPPAGLRLARKEDHN